MGIERVGKKREGRRSEERGRESEERGKQERERERERERSEMRHHQVRKFVVTMEFHRAKHNLCLIINLALHVV